MSLIFQCAVAAPSSESEGDKIFQEIAHKRKLLRLQLAPKESAFDRAFEQEIETLYKDVNSSRLTNIDERLNQLIHTG